MDKHLAELSRKDPARLIRAATSFPGWKTSSRLHKVFVERLTSNGLIDTMDLS